MRRGFWLAGCLIVLTGCSIPAMRHDDDRRLNALAHGQDQSDSFGALDGNTHMRKGFALLKAAGNSPHDRYFARAAFERAAILLIDDPRPFYMAGYLNYDLGNYDMAYRSFLSAARLEKSADGWWLAALSALRAGHEMTAQALYNRGLNAQPAHSQTLAEYMGRLYAVSNSDTVAHLPALDQALPFHCQTPTDQVSHLNGVCASDLQFEIFLITRQAEAGSSIGRDLLSGLTVGFNGNIGDISLQKSRTSSLASTDTEANVQSNSTINRNHALTIDLSSVRYALSLASDAEAVNSVTSTPVVTASLGQPAKLFVGQKLKIVGTNSNNNGGEGSSIDESIGVKLSIDLLGFTDSSASVHAVAEISDYVPPVLGTAFTQVEIDTSNVETGGRVPYNSAILLGSVEMTTRDDARGGQKGLKDVPVAGTFFGEKSTTVATHELAILLTVRAPHELIRDMEVKQLRELKTLGLELPEFAKRHKIVHASPPLSQVVGELKLEL